MNEVELHLLEEKFRYAFYGMLFFLALFMLIHYWQRRRKPFYLYYALYALCILFAFEPHFTPVRNAYIHFIEWSVVLFYFLFLNAFLELSSHFRGFRYFIDYFRKWFAVVFVLQTVLVLVKEQGLFYDPLEWLTEMNNYAFFALSTAGSIYIMSQVYRLRTVSSRYVLIGMFFLTIGMFTNQLFFPIFSIYIIWVSILIELILFALAIGYKTKRVEMDRRLAQGEMTKATLSSLQQGMSPVFFLNYLSYIPHLIQLQENQQAIDFLTRFSKLYRLVVDLFRSPKVPLSKELEICRHFLELEQIRGQGAFYYRMEIRADENLLSFVEVPPLLLQPVLESTIRHGHTYESGKSNLLLSVELKGSVLYCVIEDNGSWPLSASRRSEEDLPGIAKVRKRIELFEKIYQIPIQLKIIDKLGSDESPIGRKVTFLIGT